MCLHRFIAIVHPLNAKVFATKSRTRRIILCTWLIAILVSLPYLHCQSYAFSVSSHLGSISRRICNDRFDEIDRLWFPLTPSPSPSGLPSESVPLGATATEGSPQTTPGGGRFRKTFFVCLFVFMYLLPAVVIVYTCVHMSWRLLQPAELQRDRCVARKLDCNKRKVCHVVVFSFVASGDNYLKLYFIITAITIVSLFWYSNYFRSTNTGSLSDNDNLFSYSLFIKGLVSFSFVKFDIR